VDQAFEMLRTEARSTRRRLVEVADDFLAQPMIRPADQPDVP
jgi:hypothetical protein